MSDAASRCAAFARTRPSAAPEPGTWPRLICEWGVQGIRAWLETASVFVIVDVLSFSTAVSVATDRGATVIPFPYGDAAAARDEAQRRGAIAAVPRSASGGQLSLSPMSLRRVAVGSRILLPSPNGARLSLATGNTPMFVSGLRNARVVAQEAKAIAGNGVIAVIAAGERWDDQSLRPAVEDWLGAGAVLAALDGEMNAEAACAADAYASAGPALPDIIRASRSGRELADAGYGGDIEMALEADIGVTAPFLRNGIYGTAL